MKHLIKSMHTPHGVIGWFHGGKDSQYCEPGELVTLDWQPDDKWGLQSAFYVDDANNVVNIDLTEKTFVMPNSNITIGGIFKRFVLPDWTGSKNTDENVLDWLTVGDITPKTNDPISVVSQFIAQTTGGDMDIKNGNAQLKVLRGNHIIEDMAVIPFDAGFFVATQMNLVDPSATLTVGGKRAYYFPVVAGIWGKYGTTQSNNGFVIVGGDVHNVYFRTTKPTASNVGNVCPKTTHNYRDYYLPPTIGWLTIVCNTDEIPACHIAWSNKYDNVAGTFYNKVINIAPAIAAVHNWGLFGIETPTRTVQDFVDFTTSTGRRCFERVNLNALTWTMQTVTVTDENNETTTSYVFTATVSGMATNGLYVIEPVADGEIEVNGNALSYTSTEISTVAAFVTFLAKTRLYYELETYVDVTFAEIDTNFNANDFGLCYFMYSATQIAPIAAIAECSYQQGGKDQLFNAVNYQKQMAEIVATALCQLDKRLSAIESKRDAQLLNLIVDRKFDMRGWRMVDEQPASATANGRFGDYYITSAAMFICVATNTWKKITIGNF